MEGAVREDFSIDRFIQQANTLSEDPANLDVDVWIDFLHECLNLFKKMGSAMSMAFSGKTKLFS